MYISLNRGTTGGKLSMEEYVKLAAEAGFAGADVDINYGVANGVSALRDLYARHNMRFGGWGPGDWRNEPEKHADAIEKLKAQARVARELNIDTCVTWLMPSSKLPFMENWNFHVSRLKPVAQILADNGLRFGMEFVAPYHLRRLLPHEFIFTAGQMLELGEAIGPNVGLLVDCFHCYTSGMPWDHLEKIPASKIVCCHINDAPNVPVAKQMDGQRVLPGDGVADVPGFLKALKATSYAGPVSLETFNAELKAMAPADAAKKAWSACQRVLTAAGMA